jgi:hypothetical protein
MVEIAERMAFLVSAGARWITGFTFAWTTAR